MSLCPCLPSDMLSYLNAGFQYVDNNFNTHFRYQSYSSSSSDSNGGSDDSGSKHTEDELISASKCDTIHAGTNNILFKTNSRTSLVDDADTISSCVYDDNTAREKYLFNCIEAFSSTLEETRNNKSVNTTPISGGSNNNVPMVATINNDTPECVICLEEFSTENPIILTLCNCGENKIHFHYPCLLYYTRKKSTCPQCNAYMYYQVC